MPFRLKKGHFSPEKQQAFSPSPYHECLQLGATDYKDSDGKYFHPCRPDSAGTEVQMGGCSPPPMCWPQSRAPPLGKFRL